MKKEILFVPILLIGLIGDKLLALDKNGERNFTCRFMKDNHLSSRGQQHFRNGEAVSVMQLYAAIRILLVDTGSEWERLLLMARVMDVLEECFCDMFHETDAQHPFEGGMVQTLRRKMLAMAEFDSSVLR